jgi:hypothetical protein
MVAERGLLPAPPANQHHLDCCDAHSISEMGLMSRVTPVQTAMRNCTRDEGRSFEFGNQVLISSHRKLSDGGERCGSAGMIERGERMDQPASLYRSCLRVLLDGSASRAAENRGMNLTIFTSKSAADMSGTLMTDLLLLGRIGRRTSTSGAFSRIRLDRTSRLLAKCLSVELP